MSDGYKSETGKMNSADPAVETESERESRVKSNIARQSHIIVRPRSLLRKDTVSVVKDSNQNIHKSMPGRFLVKNAGNALQDRLTSQPDSGSAAMAATYTVGEYSYKTLKVAQKAVPFVGHTVQHTFHIAKKTIHIAHSVDSTLGLIQSGIIKVDKQFVLQLRNKALANLKNTHAVQKVIHSVDNIKTKAETFRKNIIRVKNGVIYTGSIVRNIALTGNVKLYLPKVTAQQLKKATAKGGIFLARFAGKKIKLGHAGVKHMATAAYQIGDTIPDSDEMGVQSVTVGLKSLKYGNDAVSAAPKVVKKTAHLVKTSVTKTQHVYRNGRKIAKNVKRFGTKPTARHLKHNAEKALEKAGRSVVSAAINSIKALGLKFLLPLALIIAVICAISSSVSAPVAAVGTIFGGTFTNASTNQDVNIRDYLTGIVNGKRDDLAKQITDMRDNSLKGHGGSYDSVELNIDGKKVNVTESNILNSIYSTAEYVSIMEPLFNTIVLTDYNLQPTQDQIDTTISDIWNTVTVIDTSDRTDEYTADDGSTKHKKVKVISITLDGYYDLLAKYYTNEIDSLSNLSSRTKEQQDRLDTLKSNYELCLTYIDQLSEDNSSEGSDAGDIDSSTFIGGSGNQGLVDLAITQLGNPGGEPYWSWYGFQSRVEWCACFVSWCANQDRCTVSGRTPKFCECNQGIRWFKSLNRFARNGYTPVAGNFIFFDWDGDGSADHVGIVIGCDGNKVYTVEGNSGDIVRRRSYSIHSSVILGFGVTD